MAKEEKRFRGVASIHESGPWGEYYTYAVSELQAERNIRHQYNEEHGRSPWAFVRVEDVREIK